MSKVYNYMVMTVGLVFLLKFAGIDSGADAFISWLGLSDGAEGVSLGAFIAEVTALFIVGTGASIIIGFFSKANPESTIIAGFASGLFAVMASTFVSVVNYTKDFGFAYYISFMIFIPLLVGFGIALISYWRGSGG